jgi:hypothetical protein
MIDNFDIIAPILNQEDPESFHFLQIIKRRKENPDLPKGEKLVDTFLIGSSEDLISKKKLITEIAELNNARVYINLNKNSYKKVALKVLEILAKKCSEEEYKSAHKIYHHVCGKYHTEKNKKWIIDLDGEDTLKKEEIKKNITTLYDSSRIRKHTLFFLEVPTINGVHLVTSPFNPEEVPVIKSILHKNPMTLLYYSKGTK